MITSITAVAAHRFDARHWQPRVALVAIVTPGCSFATPPRAPVLRLSFDTLGGELEAAATRLAGAAAAVPFSPVHVRALRRFLGQLLRSPGATPLVVTESEGATRSLTVARWAARWIGCCLELPVWAEAVPSCTLMDQLLRDTAPVHIGTAGRITRPAPRSAARGSNAAWPAGPAWQACTAHLIPTRRPFEPTTVGRTAPPRP